MALGKRKEGRKAMHRGQTEGWLLERWGKGRKGSDEGQKEGWYKKRKEQG